MQVQFFLIYITPVWCCATEEAIINTAIEQTQSSKPTQGRGGRSQGRGGRGQGRGGRGQRGRGRSGQESNTNQTTPYV